MGWSVLRELGALVVQVAVLMVTLWTIGACLGLLVLGYRMVAG